jgi:nicotinamide mononucleotide transporter
MIVYNWLSDNYIEIFGAIAGIVYVFLEIRQSIWLWPVGIITSAVYIWVFFTSKFYADMSLQGYYLIISCLGWYWWAKGAVRRAQSTVPGEEERAIVFLILFAIMWIVLSRLTDSPVPEWDSFLTSLSIVATWMLARKIYEHWLLWIVVNFVSVVLFLIRGLYPTVILYVVYGIMSFVGLTVWRKTIRNDELRKTGKSKKYEF